MKPKKENILIHIIGFILAISYCLGLILKKNKNRNERRNNKYNFKS